MPSSDSVARCTARPRSTRRNPSTAVRCGFSAEGAAWNHVAMEQAIRDAGLQPDEISQRAHRHHHGIGRTIHPRHCRGGRCHAREGPQARRAFRSAESHVVHRVRHARHLVQDQGRELFDLVGLRDLQSLYRQCRRDHPMGQAGPDFRRRLRGTRLDALGTVRRHGRDVVEIQRHAGKRFARL